MSTSLNLYERVSKHWLGGVLTIASVSVVATFVIIEQVQIKPRDYEIERQAKEINNLNQKIGDLKTQSEKANKLVEAIARNKVEADSSTYFSENVSKLTLISPKMYPNVSKNSIQKILGELHNESRIRELMPLEADNFISKTPTGTYFYVFAAYLSSSIFSFKERFSQARVSRKKELQKAYFEIHFVSEKKVSIIAFVSNDASTKVSRLDGLNKREVTLFPAISPEAHNLVVLPVERIVEATARNIDFGMEEGFIILDVVLH